MNERIIPTVAFLMAIGIFFVYVSPTWSGTIAETKNAIAQNVRALDAANKYTARQNELASARNSIDLNDLKQLSALLPDSVDNVRLILDLNALAARSGLALSNIDVTSTSVNTPDSQQQELPVSGANPLGSIDLSLTAIGTYSALQSFIVGIEKSSRLLDVRDIVVKGSDTGVYNYQMKLRLYWLR